MLGPAMTEKRQFERAEFSGATEVEVGGRRFAANLRDLSVGGAYVLTNERLAFNTPVALWITLPAIADKGPRRLSGLVRWVREDGFGVQFGPTGALETYALAEYVARSTRQL
jgi:hypothetical protein